VVLVLPGIDGQMDQRPASRLPVPLRHSLIHSKTRDESAQTTGDNGLYVKLPSAATSHHALAGQQLTKLPSLGVGVRHRSSTPVATVLSRIPRVGPRVACSLRLKCNTALRRGPTPSSVWRMRKRWAAWPSGTRWLVGIAVVVLAAAILWALFVPLADWLAHHDVGPVKGALHETAVDNARGRLLTLVAGLFAAGALVFTALNFNLSREGQVTDRYTKAIEQLGSDKLDVRIGGVYALERVARDSAKDHPTVMEVLTAFIREHSREQWPPSDGGRSERERLTRPDVQAAVTVTGRRDTKRDILPINLADAELTHAHLRGARLADADLRDTHFTGANLLGAVLARADLARADLTGAYLRDAVLTGAYLRDAVLTGADLRDADLPGANFTGARLADAKLTDANLAGANLAGARLGRYPEFLQVTGFDHG
jgi:Pentapeptide repeats (8 copies)